VALGADRRARGCRVLTLGSLFSGIGGLELGVEAATGALVLWQVEKDAWCREVLAKHWPDAVRYDDVCTVNGLPRVDIICGGFPCQDVSLAGKRAGFGGTRSSLWREYRRVVADVGPRFVFVENVAGLLTADDGWAFGEVLGDLAALGFDATWDVFRASDVGAPHRRERVFLLAYRSGERECEPEHGRESVASRRDAWVEPRSGGESPVADAISGRRNGRADGAGGHERDGTDATRGEGAVRPTNGSEGVDLGDFSRGVRQRPTSGHGRHAAFADQGLVNADGQRRAERDRAAVAGQAKLRGAGGAVGRDGCGGTLARVGLPADGLPRRLGDHQWPAGRGEAQHEGEPSRTASGVPMRAAQLKAYGNAVVPQCAALAWRVLSARVRSEAA